MQEFHNLTDITIKNSFEQNQFIDWRTQPKSYKTYPEFFRRFNLDDYEELKFIKNFGKTTYTKTYGKDEVKLRANPSAGGLYPCEIYIQIRGIKGFLSGIYHYESTKNSLALIHELSLDGVESYFKDTKQQKFIFLISNVYFRSSWKYGKRTIRYLLLDTGHQIASIYAGLKLVGHESLLNFDFDKKLLNEEFGFEGFEFFQTSILSQEYKEKEPKKLREKLVNVSACDYQIREAFVEEFYEKICDEKSPEISKLNFLNEFSKEELQETVNKRRSIRAFKKETITKDEFKFITKDIFEFSLAYGIEIFFVNNNIEGLTKGVYKNVTLQRAGDFSEKASNVAFNQKLGGNSAFTLFFTSKTSSNYVQNSILSGFLAHIINLRSSYLDIGCSGIGAFFDDLCKEFFETSNNILYLQAVGR
ncbi:MAG: hypothetical protein C0625_00505 [Arcobacter sp.]|nr:MAG: hypothetical protein C0625_00505 [Arcobacter sp.]